MIACVIAWAFPGQGSQRARMGAQLPPFGALAERARRAVGIELVQRCVHDPDPAWPPDELQQAIFVTTRAAAAAAHDERRAPPHAVVGHSLGEYAALVEAGALDYDAALQLVDVRGRAMAAAGADPPGAMAAVVGLSPDAVEATCAPLGDVWVANVNSPRQTVVSGTREAVAAATEQLQAAGAQLVVPLPITIACHTPLMAPAAERLRAALATTTLHPPRIPVYSCVDATPKHDPDDIVRALVDGVTRPVRFAATVARMRADGVTDVVEIGPGNVLRGLLRDNGPTGK
ncbi:MAG TPA: ACP S-malonyltransferase [Conexibacter sp.]